MQGRFNPRRNFRRRYFPSQNHYSAKKPNQDLMWAITAGRSINGQGENKNVAKAPEFIAKNKFEDFQIDSTIKRNIAAIGYFSPTPIQDQVIPAVLSGFDVIGIANTGTGKTASFLVPLLDKVLKDSTQRVLVIVPTRELAQQIRDDLGDFAKGLNIRSALCIGGTNLARQRNDLNRDPNFVIGTPGRIRDFIGQRCLNLSQFNNVVIDEADRLVDIGFIADIKFFISLLPQNRQSLFFSATIPPKVKEILESFVRDPVTISTKVGDTSQNIEQDIVKVERHELKVDKLHDLLIKDGFEKVLIFARTKRGVQRLTNELTYRGFKAGVLHGNKSQNQRQKTLDQFKNNQIKILLATDIASRGLDIDDVSHVINYDMPASYEDYIHRIGRTGRANKKGTALTFVD